MTEELICEYSYWNGGVVKCGEPATYTLRLNNKVYHFCKEHYQDTKDVFRDIENE